MTIRLSPLAAFAMSGAMLAAGCSSPSEPKRTESKAETAPVALGPGDIEAGRRAFGRCRSCHAVEAGVNRVGPSLSDVVGRPAGAAAGYSYSKAMQDSGVIWTEEALEAYLENPRKHVPGTKMSFAGVSDPQERRDVIAYLKSLP